MTPTRATDTLTVIGTQLPTAGTWTFDTAHSSIEFVARHLMMSKVRGRFSGWDGSITVGDPVTGSSVDVTIDTASVDTRDAKRDEHLRSSDFFDVENFPAMTFRSTGVRASGDRRWQLEGDLTIRGTTRPVVLDLEYLGIEKDPWGKEHAGFSASTELDREEFGLKWNAALESGGVLVGKKVKIELDIQAIRAA